MTANETGTAETGEHADGRRAKGERRRQALIDATLRVVERDGTGSVSHRNIAREAGVPPASIAYYFDSIDDLLVAALMTGVDMLIVEVERLRQVTSNDAGSWARAIAEMLSSLLTEKRGRTIVEYELYLLAVRRPALRPAARKWIEVASGYINDGEGADSGILLALFAAIDGLLMQGLVADQPPTADELEPALFYLLQPVEYLARIGELPPELLSDEASSSAGDPPA